jgi:PAS domain S-box-containing protein
MDNTEKLREALLDLEESRRREEKARQISEVILAGLRAIVLAENPDEIFHAVLDVLREPLDIKDAFVLTEQRDGTMTVTASSDPSFADTIWQPHSMLKRALAGQPIAVYDTNLVEEWRSQPDPIRERVRSALHFAIHISRPRTLFVCTHSAPAHFSKRHVTLARRFSVLATEALQKIESNIKISGLKQAEKELEERNALINQSQAIAHIGSWELDLATNQLNWSDEVYRILGLRPQEFSATYEAFLEIIHPDDRAAVDAAYSGSVREGRLTYEIEHRIIRRNTGEIRVVQEKCKHIKDDSGRIVRSVGMVHDITERKRAEEKLIETEKRLRIAGKAAYDLIYEWNVKTDSLDWFADIDGLLGYKPGEISRDINAWLDLIHPEDKEQLGDAVMRHRTSTDPIKYEYRIKHRDGSWRYWKDYALPLLDEKGIPYRWIGVCTDITEHKRAETELLLKDMVFERSLSANSIANSAGIITHVNDTFIKLWGYKSRNEVIGRPISDFMRSEDESKKIITELDETGNWEGEYSALKKNGTTFSAYGLATIITDKSGDNIGYHSGVLDITARKQVEEELIKHQEHLEEMVKDRTSELKKSEEYLKEKIKELEIFYDATVDRELRMEELRVEIEELKNTDAHRG